MDARTGDESADEEEVVVMALLLHQRQIIVHAFRRRGLARTRKSRRHPASRTGKKGNKQRHFSEALQRMSREYFGLDGQPPTYDEMDFERRLRMPRILFMRIYYDIKDEHWWQQRPNATGQLQAHPLIKLEAALRVLSYGDGQDRIDECQELSKTTVHNAVTRLITFILENYQAVYLRAPTMENLKTIMRLNAGRSLPGCIGSLDCSHWRWTKCPVVFQGMYQKGGRGRQRTIVLETVCDENLWIWHIFDGSSGGNNDVNVLAQSPLMVRVKRGQWPPHGLDFTVNGSSFHCPYYLMDGIYPCYSLLVSPHPNRTTPQERTFNRLQEAICKDVERSHAVLTARFQMALRPARSTHVSTLIRTAKAIAILHNITTEQRRSGYVSRSRSGFGEGDMAAGAADDATPAGAGGGAGEAAGGPAEEPGPAAD